MKKKKIFIISYNKLPIDFWKSHINYEEARIWLWKSPEHAINNLSTVFPDIVIIDGYWATESISSCLIKVLKEKNISKIFCLSPITDSDTKIISIDNRLIISNFNSDVLKKINEWVTPSKILTQIINQTA